jgi:hypothetical protein
MAVEGPGDKPRSALEQSVIAAISLSSGAKLGLVMCLCWN